MAWSSEDLKRLAAESARIEESDQERFFKAFKVRENVEHRVEPMLVYYWYLKWKEDNLDLDILKKRTFFKVKYGFPKWVKRSDWHKTTMLWLDKSSFPINEEVRSEIKLILKDEAKSRRKEKSKSSQG